MDRSGMSDPYVVLLADAHGVLKKKGKTKVKMETLSPEWNEVVDVRVDFAQYLQVCIPQRTNTIIVLHSLSLSSYTSSYLCITFII